MVLNGDDFLAQLLDTFRGEAHEHLSAMAAGLLILEQSETPREEYETTIEQVFRETHSLKGAARAVGLREIENLCQQQESVFSAVRKGTLILHPEDFDLFHSVIRTLERLLAEEKGVKITDLLTRLRKLIACAEKENPEKLSKDKTLSQEESGGIVHPEKLSSPAILTVNEKEPSPVSIQDKSLKPPLEEDKEVKPKGSPAGIAAINHEVHAASDSDGNVKNQRIEKPEISVDEPDILLTPPEESKVYKQDPPTAIKDDDIMQTQHISKGGGMIKIASDRLEKLFTKADDLMGARLAAGQRSTSLRELSQNFLHWRWAWTQISTDIEHLRTQTGQETSGSLSPLPAEIERINGFLDYNRAFIKTLETDITTLTRAATRDQYLLDTATTELIDEIKQVILVPAASLLDTYPRAARDLARDSGKDVDVLISGAEIEIDRRILDGIRDPIMHIIRNSIDHGIEEPDIRQSKGKSKRGQIRISVIHVRGHQAEIRIADDGAGIDVQRVSSAAVTKGLISAEEVSRMENSQIFRYIFKSGLSTKKIVTTVSGRGLGLAIALEKVEQIGGDSQSYLF